MTGWFTEFAKAEQSRIAYSKSENIEMQVIPYINGQRQTLEEVKNLSAGYPDLLNYITKNKKPQNPK
jgi:hypothetical protein